MGIQYSQTAADLFENDNITAQELADRAGISRGMLQRIEKGNLKCEIGAVNARCNYSDVN